MMKKKVLAFSGLFLAVLFLSGCGVKNQEQNKEQNQEQAQSINGPGNGNGNQERRGNGENGGLGGPTGAQSEEAQAACANKSEGDTCSFTSTPPNGQGSRELTGICAKSLGGIDDALSCRPGRLDPADDSVQQ